MRRRNILALLMAAALCLCLLAGCGSAETTDSTGTSITEATTIADLKGMKIAAQAGTFHADALNQIENVQGSTYPEFADLLTALKSGAIRTATSPRNRRPSPSARATILLRSSRL